MSTLARFIKHKGDKVESKTTSVNLPVYQIEFLKERDLNLSAIVRERIEELILEADKNELKGGVK